MIAKMSYAIAHAAAWDAGNRSMRKHGRACWSKADWNHACDEFNRLWPIESELADRGEPK